MAATLLIHSKSLPSAAPLPKARHAGMKRAIFATARNLAESVSRKLPLGQEEHFDEGEAA